MARPTIALLGIVSLAAQAPAQGFSQQAVPSVGSVGVALGDLDGDGRVDAVNPSFFAASVAVHRGGAAGFEPPTLWPTPIWGSYVALGDLNHDGRLDAVISSDTAGLVVTTTTVFRLLGDGAGGFGPAVEFAVPFGPTGLTIADLNGDANPDVAVANRFGIGSLSLLFGNGAGGFSPATVIAPGIKPWALVSGDFDLDGVPDLAATRHLAQEVSVLRGTGMGAFAAPAPYATGLVPRALATSDVNGDGRLDLAIGNEISNDVTLWFGQAGGAFANAATLSAGTEPRGIALGDVDSDGGPDVLVANQGSGTVSWLRGDGSGAFSTGPAFVVGGDPTAIAIGDFGSDGFADVAMVGLFSGVFTACASLAPLPAGVTSFGSGTAGCSGTLGISTNASPRVGTSVFGLLCTNAPANALGLGLVANAADFAGSDPFGLGATFHVDLLAASTLMGIAFHSAGSGTAFAPAPIPSLPGLAGAVAHAQAVWLESTAGSCSASAFAIVTSRGMTMSISP